MKVAGIIAEYNPFHNGHAYQIQQTRKQATHIIAVMSGHLTQRGSISCYSKWIRAKAAIQSGVDLVLELPTSFACSSAERFALGGIGLLGSLGIVDCISFGSESGDISSLMECANQCLNINQSPEMQQLLKQGLSYPAARRRALGKKGYLLDFPNNTLGVEYIKAAKQLGFQFEWLTIQRQGASHDSEIPTGDFASASYLRGQTSWENFIPQNCRDIYQPSLRSNPEQLEMVLLYLIRTTTKQQWAELPDVSEGLENRLYESGKIATSSEQFLSIVKTKRYTMSRLRRILSYRFLDIQKANLESSPLYGRVLGMNQKGKELLSKIRTASTIPVSPDFPKLARQFPKQAALDSKATDLFYMTTPQIQKAGQDYLQKPIIQ
ncbi:MULTISPECIES: tRNA(Met) cytidine acetate ligase [Clostridiaceae]|uniref:tRNA(Met) cytidine acetate ligase n=1 Tax=Clostridium facile TaxID=2763035 RepID=A0ABR7ITR7_9CLOT|nr:MULTISPECIES: nucleotidyltransferase family protein [Clostridiaceae]MBC5788473.1 nucleotidyltransferase family protein [Clostridium facile]